MASNVENLALGAFFRDFPTPIYSHHYRVNPKYGKPHFSVLSVDSLWRSYSDSFHSVENVDGQNQAKMRSDAMF